MKDRTMTRLRSGQQGVMLLEALIGVLIFSLGVLALIAMQSVSISSVSNAKYRVEAAFLAEEIMNYMWLDPQNIQAGYAWPGGNSQYIQNWVARVQAGGTGLPNSVTFPPTVVITNLAPAGQPPIWQATVRINWKAPDALTPSQHIATTYITNP
jgi:type IV pilus assembly protein PilV